MPSHPPMVTNQISQHPGSIQGPLHVGTLRSSYTNTHVAAGQGEARSTEKQRNLSCLITNGDRKWEKKSGCDKKWMESRIKKSCLFKSDRLRTTSQYRNSVLSVLDPVSPCLVPGSPVLVSQPYIPNHDFLLACH